MIRVALFNWRNDSFRVDLTAVPVRSDGDYRCSPEGILSLEYVQRISAELLEGRMSGWVKGYRWYRQAMARGDSKSQLQGPPRPDVHAPHRPSSASD